MHTFTDQFEGKSSNYNETKRKTVLKIICFKDRRCIRIYKSEFILNFKHSNQLQKKKKTL
jgi:hypothetical protein